jgi:hypothetical protein
MKRNTLSFRTVLLGGFSFVLAFGSIACDGAVEADPVNTAPAHVDLFACGVELSCPTYCAHLGYGDCGGPQTADCAGDLWLEGASGSIMFQDRPGPGSWMGDKLTLLLGDGKALVQERTRSCPDGEWCTVEDLPWELGAHQLCDVKTPPPNCQPGDCSFIPTVENCAPVEKEWTCGEAKSAVSPAP